MRWHGGEVLERVRTRVEAWPVGTRVLLVVDTFSKWSRISDENDATAAMAAYRPLVLLTKDLHLATLVIRHARKGDHEDVTDTARGSNAASGEVDIILSLGRLVGRPGDGRSIRRLRAAGRHPGLVEDRFIEIRDGGYTVLDDGGEVQAEEHRQRVLRSVAADPGSTYDDISADTGIVRTSVQLAVAELLHPGVAALSRSGRGVKGDPHRLFIAPDSVENPVRATSSRDHPSGIAGSPPPASRGPFSTESRAHLTVVTAGFPTASAILSETPSERPRTSSRPVALDIDPDATDLVMLARATFEDEIAAERTVPAMVVDQHRSAVH